MLDVVERVYLGVNVGYRGITWLTQGRYVLTW